MIHISSFVTYKLPLKKVSKNLSHPLPSLTAYHSLLRIFTNWTIERIIRDDERKFRLTLPSPPPPEIVHSADWKLKRNSRVYTCVYVCIVGRRTTSRPVSLYTSNMAPIQAEGFPSDQSLFFPCTSCTTISPMVNRERDAWTMKRERTVDETRVEEKDGGVARIAERQ